MNPAASKKRKARGGTTSDRQVADVASSLQGVSLGTCGEGSGNGGGGGGNGGDGNGNAAYPAAGRGSIRGGKTYEQNSVLVTRPASAVIKQGSSGEKRMVTVNFFKLLTKPSWRIYKHHVDISPDEDRNHVRKALLREHKERLGGIQLFDGSTIFSIRMLCEQGKPLELVSTNKEGQVFKITVKFVGLLEKHDYGFIQVFNLVMRKCMDLMNLTQMSRNYYDPKMKVVIPEFQMEVWPGYQTSIRQYENDILLNCEVMHKVCRLDNALDLWLECRQDKARYLDQIVNTTVITYYNEGTYRVSDVDFKESPSSKFAMKTGEMKSYIEYYKQKYSVTIKNANQPLLIVRSTVRQQRSGQDKVIKLVPELCKMTGLTDRMRSNFRLMKALSAHTCIEPKERVKKYNAFNERLLALKDAVEELRKWDMSLSKDLLKVPARILPIESIEFGGGQKVSAGPQADWQQQFKNCQMLQSAKLQNWVVLYPARSVNASRGFAANVMKAAGGMSFPIAQPSWWPVENENNYAAEIDDALNKYNPAMVMCIMQGNQSERYKNIKKKCIIDRPVPSQVMLLKTCERPGLSVATKVAIQMNCKLGGAPWSAVFPFSNVMIVGYDVGHDTQDKRKSWGAMVGSLNKSLSRWYSSVTQHIAGEEIGAEFKISLLNAVKKYRAVNQRLPERIICYRDGVDDGKIAHVLDIEVKAVTEALEKVYKDANVPPVRFGFIIVSKNNTRIIADGGNPAPGTIIDDVITEPTRYDFYLISQNVKQGSVSPTHYNVVYDTMGLDPDKVQRLTYKLTHLYYNWSGTVRVPAPCQYAHKLAFLVGNYIHRPHCNMDDLLYFL